MRNSRGLLLLIPGLLALTVPVAGQSPYQQPPQDVVAILDAPPPPQAIVSPARDAMLLVERRSYPSIALVAGPVLRLAGVRINPRVGCTQRFTQTTGMTIKPLSPADAPARRLDLPEGEAFHSPHWSFDGKSIALARDVEDGVELWVADASNGRVKLIPGARLNDVLASPVAWLSDNRHLLAVLIPENRGPAPPEPKVPIGPNVQESTGRLSQMATFQDLLASPHDEDLFEYYGTSQVARIDTVTGKIERIGPAGLITRAEASPDENYLLVGTVRRPFSYRVPYNDFARKTEVWDKSGRSVAVVADLPITDDIPRQGVPTGPRGIDWQPLHPARLLWTEALDGGDPCAKVPHRDTILALDAPFTEKPTEVLKIQHRFAGFQWMPEPDLALVSEIDRDRRWRTTALVDLTKPEASRRVLFDLSVNDAYHNPGTPVTRVRSDGVRTILRDGDAIYLAGMGAAPEGARPFLDRMDLQTGARTRLFRCAEQTFENPLGFVGDSRETILIEHETRTDPPNDFTINLANGRRTKLTDYRDPAPSSAG